MELQTTHHTSPKSQWHENLEKNDPCYFEFIPFECVCHIFNFLNAQAIVQASQVCKNWYRATKDKVLNPAIQFLVETSPNRCVFNSTLQVPQNTTQIPQNPIQMSRVCQDLFHSSIRLFMKTPDISAKKKTAPSKRIKCENLFVRQINSPIPNYQMVISFSAGSAHWGNFYDVHQKKQIKIALNDWDFSKRNLIKFLCFFQNTLIKLDKADLRSKLSLNVYHLDKEGTCKFKKKICDLDNVSMYTCDSKKYLAILTGTFAYKIKIYQKHAIELKTISHPTLLQRHSVCNAICFAGNRLITGLTLLNNKKGIIRSQSQTWATESDFNIQNPCYDNLQSIDPDTGKLLINQPQPGMVTKMVGDENTLVVARRNSKEMTCEVWILDPLTLEDKFKIKELSINHSVILRVQEDKIVVFSAGARVLEIFRAIDGKPIRRLRHPCFIDVALAGNYAAIATSNAVEIWDLEAKRMLKRTDTGEYELEKIHFHIGDGDLDKTAYLIIVLSNGEVHTWTLSI